jgi:hypothetical protein
MTYPLFHIAAIMRRRTLVNRRQTHAWEVAGIVADPGGHRPVIENSR